MSSRVVGALCSLVCLTTAFAADRTTISPERRGRPTRKTHKTNGPFELATVDDDTSLKLRFTDNGSELRLSAHDQGACGNTVLVAADVNSRRSLSLAHQSVQTLARSGLDRLESVRLVERPLSAKGVAVRAVRLRLTNRCRTQRAELLLRAARVDDDSVQDFASIKCDWDAK